MSRNVLVTGGAGFIGSTLARALVKQGDSVRVIDDLSSGRLENLAGIREAVTTEVGSILDPACLRRAVEGVEVIFHQAAVPSVPRSLAAPMASHEANATGTLAVLEAARQAGVKRVVYAGSSSAYGETPTLPKVEDMPTIPLSPYAAAKLSGENYCRVYARVFGLQTVVLRYFNVFGPRQDPKSEYAAVIPKFITCALEGRSPVIFGDGLQSRDFCFVDNAVDANLKASVAPGVSGLVFNVACGEATNLNTVLEMVVQMTGCPVAAEYLPSRIGDVKHSLADIRAAREKLGYSPAVSFQDGLRRTVAWFQGGTSA